VNLQFKRAIKVGLIGIAGWLALISCQAIDAPDWTPSPGRVLFGLMGPFTAGTTGGPVVEGGARLAVNEINAAGGVQGQQIDIVTADDRCDSSTGPVAVQQLLNQNVVAIIGGDCSAPTLSAIDSVLLHLSAPIAMISPAATSPYLTGSYLVDAQTYFFRIYPSDTKQATVLSGVISSAGVKTVNIIYVGTNPDGTPNLYGTGLYQALLGQNNSGGALSAAGISLAGTPVSYAQGTTEFTGAQISQLFAAQPQGVILISYPLEAAGISRAIQQFDPSIVGVTQLFGTDSAYDPALLTNSAVQVIEGLTGTAPGPDPGNPNYQKFLANYEAVTGVPPAPNAEAAYDAVYILSYAAIKGGALTSKAMEPNIALVTGGVSPTGGVDSDATTINVDEFATGASVLESGRNISYSGAYGNIRLDVLGDPTVGSYTIWKVVNGSFVTVTTVTE
jgi:branched-chain amino acid transport system substrate-binding protein